MMAYRSNGIVTLHCTGPLRPILVEDTSFAACINGAREVIREQEREYANGEAMTALSIEREEAAQ